MNDFRWVKYMMALGVALAAMVLLISVLNRDLILGNRDLMQTSLVGVNRVLEEHAEQIDTLRVRIMSLEIRANKLEALPNGQ